MKSYKSVLVMIAVLLSVAISSNVYATILINPTGAGGFELGSTFPANGWTVVNDVTNQWYVGTVINYAGTYGAYISNDVGITNAYTSTVLQTSHFYRDISFPSGENSITLSFYWNGYGEDGWDRLLVYIAPTSVTPVAGVPASNSTTFTGATLIGGPYDIASAWTSASIAIPGSYAGSTARLIFTWQNDAADGTQPPAAIDNISLVSRTLVPLVGGNTYPINGTENPPVSFASITSAASYMSSDGVTGTGQVILQLSTGYTGEPAYPVTFSAIPGVSALLGVTIRPASGQTLTIESSSATAIFNLNGVNYLTIDGRAGGTGTSRNLTISNTSTSGPAIQFINGTSYNTVTYCIIKSVITTTTSGVVLFSTSTGGNNHNTIDNCVITAGATFPANAVIGYGTASPNWNQYNTVQNSSIYDFSANGIYLYSNEMFFTGTNNDIYTATQQTSTSINGINVYGSNTTCGTFTRNKIHDFLSSGASPSFRAFYLYYGSTTYVTTIANNFISFDAITTHPTATVYGFYELSGTGYRFDIYYNSICIGGTSVTGGVSYGIYRGLGCYMNVKNNTIFNNRVNGTGTGNHYCIYGSSTASGFVSNNNDLYAPNAYGYIGYWTAAQQTLAAWRTASNQDFNSVSQDPNYINVATSPPDLHINTAIATRLESGGIPIAGITTDIDGDIRAGSTKIHNNVQPDIGADEFNGTALDEMPPVITYTPIVNNPYTTNQTLTATITDYVSGVANNLARAPRLYYKKGTAGTWAIDTVLTSTGNNWTFTFNYSRVGGVIAGDTIFYYVQATDSSNNTGTIPLAGATAPAYYRILALMSGNYNIGTGQTYTTLKSFFNALNVSGIVGNITGTIMSDITETYSDTLNPLNYFGGNWQVSIVPGADKTVYTISGAIAGPLVFLNGADNITFNGMGKNLVFRNTSTSGKVFQLMNDATYNTITSCIIEGCGTSTSYSIIYIYTSATGTLGNSYNVISGNDIRDLSTTGVRPYCAIYSYGTAAAPNNSNTISNNNIFNFSYYGIYIGSTGNGGNWTISGNSFYYNNATLLSTGHYAIYFYPGAAANNNMIYSNFIGGSLPNCGGIAYTTSSSFYGIYAYSFGTSVKSVIRKNTIKNITLTNTGSYGFYGIYIYTGGNVQVDSNIIGDPSLPARDLAVPSYNNVISSNSHQEEQKRIADNGMILAIDNIPAPTEPNALSAVSDGTVIKTDRTENSISVAGTSGTYGIYSYTAFPIKIEANEVSNMTASGTGTSVACRGIVVAASAACTVDINSNIAHHIKSAGTSTSLGGTATGIYYWPSAFNSTGQFYNNTAYAIIATNNTAVQNNAVGLIVNNTAIPAYNNKAYDIRNASIGTTATTPPAAVGMVVGATSYPAVYNNMISVGDGQTTNTEFIGIWNYFGTNNGYGLYNNSVLVMGTCTDGALPSFGYLRGNNSGTAVVTRTDAKNNIFVNTRSGGTGFHYALGNQSTTADSFGWWFDNNILKTANPATLGLWGLTDLSFTNWLLPHPAGSGGDAHSINADPGYMSVSNLHINPNSLVPNRKAIPISGLTDDIDGDIRNPMAPDIGADEYTPNAPQEFTLINPVNGAITQPLTGQLVWYQATLAEFYDVYLDVVNPPVTIISGLQTDTTCTYYGIMPNTTYYWKVVAQNDTGMIPVEGSMSSPIWSFDTEIWDVGVTAIVRPLPVSFAGNVITPQVKVKNFGTGMVPSFTATMTITSIYTSTKPVTNLMPGDSVIVYFDPWTAVMGTYNMMAWTSLELDNNHANDTVRGSVEVQAPAHNVGTMEIISPALDTVLEGTVITPSARIKNFGAYTESFTVRFKIGDDYNQVLAITNFVSNAETTLVFPNWTAQQCNHVVSCSTELDIDQLPEDDKITKMLTVQYIDVGVSAILVPQDTVNVCNDYTPTVVVTNYGFHTQPALCTLIVKIIQYPAEMLSYCTIGRASQGVVIYQEEYITEISEGNTTITLPTWHPYFWDIRWISDPTNHDIIAWIKTANDMNPDDDMLEKSFIVKGRANDLQMNWTGLLTGYEVMHADTIANVTYNVASAVSLSEGGPNARFKVWVKIIRERDNAVVYTRYKDVTMNAGTYYCIPFSTGWTATEPGSYLVRSWIEAKPGVDIITENSTWEKRYYVMNTVAKVANKSNQSAQGNSSNLPTTFKLMANNPNPFSNMTKILWQIPVESKVTISIYDATGRNIKTLINDNRTPGYYSIIWNRIDDNNKKVSAGIYFYEMRTDKYTARRKMVITN
jgi:hypothetical protein